MIVRGTVLHCSRFGAVVRLEDGRLALYPSGEPGMPALRRAASGGKRPQFPFDVGDASARRLRLSLAPSALEIDDEPRHVEGPAAAALEQKIIDYLRQTAEWDPRASQAPAVRGDERPRADRLLPFELRARRQYRDSAERPRGRKR